MILYGPNILWENFHWTSRHTRIVLVVLIILSGAFDLGTFLLHHQYNAFEVNPIWLLTNSLWVMVVFKVAVLWIFCWIVLRGAEWGWLSYAVVLSALYNVVGQVYGGISNLQVAVAQPGLEQVLPPEVAMKTYMTMAVVYQLLPLVMATLAYQIHKWGGYSEEKKV